MAGFFARGFGVSDWGSSVGNYAEKNPTARNLQGPAGAHPPKNLSEKSLRLYAGAMGLRAGLLLCLLLAGCSTAPATNPATPTPKVVPSPGETRAVIGADKVGLIVPPHPNGSLVMAVHGHGGDVDEWLTGDLQAGVRQALLGAGYSLATSDGAGNAWGGPASVKAYEDLYAWAEAKTGSDDVVLLGQSMGGLAALQLVGRVPAKSFIGVYPVCNLASMTDKFPTFRQAWPGGAPTALSPVQPAYPPGFRAIFFSSPADTTVPKASHKDVCTAAAKAAGVDVTVIPVQGAHGVPSPFHSARVLQFLKGA